MREIRTAAGYKHEIRFCGTVRQQIVGALFIELVNISITEAVEIFSNAEHTWTLYDYIDGEINHTFVGYTSLQQVIMVDENNVRIKLEATA